VVSASGIYCWLDMIVSHLLCVTGAKVTDTIRKGIIDIEPYENATAVLMVGNVAALTGNNALYSNILVFKQFTSLFHWSLVANVVTFYYEMTSFFHQK